MTVFTAAIDALFADPNLGLNAVYRVGGADPAIPVRVILRRPDRIGNFGETRLLAAATVVEVRAAEVPPLAEGDAFEIDGEIFVVQGEPVRDSERLVWTAELRKA